MSGEEPPQGVPADEWRARASGPRREGPARSPRPRTNYDSVQDSFTMGLQYFHKGELVPADDPVAAKVAREHPELLHLILPEPEDA
jgi:hypothetical protein